MHLEGMVSGRHLRRRKHGPMPWLAVQVPS